MESYKSAAKYNNFGLQIVLNLDEGFILKSSERWKVRSTSKEGAYVDRRRYYASLFVFVGVTVLYMTKIYHMFTFIFLHFI